MPFPHAFSTLDPVDYLLGSLKTWAELNLSIAGTSNGKVTITGTQKEKSLGRWHDLTPRESQGTYVYSHAHKNLLGFLK